MSPPACPYRPCRCHPRPPRRLWPASHHSAAQRQQRVCRCTFGNQKCYCRCSTGILPLPQDCPCSLRLMHSPSVDAAAVSRGKQLGLTAHYLPAGIVVTVFRCTGARGQGFGSASVELDGTPCALCPDRCVHSLPLSPPGLMPNFPAAAPPLLSPAAASRSCCRRWHHRWRQPATGCGRDEQPGRGSAASS